MDIAEAEGIAIRALGSLFKLTENFLWDDFHTINFERAQSKDLHGISTSDMNNKGKCSTSFAVDDGFSVSEDLELAQEMGALGLPISFSTNKERRKDKPKGKVKKDKGKLPPAKNIGSFESRSHGTGDLIAVSSQHSPDIPKNIHQMEVTFDTDGNDQSKANIPHENEIDFGRENAKKPLCEENGEVAVVEKVKGDIAEITTQPLYSNDFVTLDVSSKDPSYVQYPSYLHENSQNESCFDIVRDFGSGTVDSGNPACYVSNHTELREHSLVVDLGNETISDGSSGSVESHNWMVIRDTFYEMNYFYNTITEESTWYPPPGFEEYQSFLWKDGAQISDVTRGISNIGTQGELSKGTEACNFLVTDSFMIREKNGNSPMETTQPLNEIMPSLSKVSKDLVSDDKISGLQFPCSVECVGDLNLHKANDFFDGQETQNMASYISGCEYHNNRFTTVFNGLGSEEIDQREILPRGITHSEHDIDNCHDVAICKKKAVRIRSRQKITSDGNNGLLEINPEVAKYWCQRYSLFSRFDFGIKMDVEGWYSVTPEKIAEHQASRCGNGIIIDCFTGVGGNTIQFAMKSKHVVAIDIDPLKIDYARHNATTYGVQDRIDFILGDFFHLTLKGDVVFLSPPWGGPDYGKVQTYDIQTMLQPHNADLLFKTASKISPRVVMFLPRNVNLNQLAELALMTNPPWELEVEKNFLNGKLKAITAYFQDTSRCKS